MIRKCGNPESLRRIEAKQGTEIKKDGERKAKKVKKKRKKDVLEKRGRQFKPAVGEFQRAIPVETPIRQNQRREIDIDWVVKILKEKNSFLCIGESRELFAFTGKIFENITDQNKAAAVFKKFLAEDINRLFRDYSEVYKQLLSDETIWYSSMDAVKRNRNVIVFENGTYDVIGGQFYQDQYWKEDFVFSIIHFDFDPKDMTNSRLVDDFVDQFCDGDADKRQLLYEIVGYCLSSYENKKVFFYFLGVPDSGKSTLCWFLETAVGDDAYISVAIKQLNSRFVSGDLVGKKICADEDVAIKTPLKSEDVSLIKKITSSDKIRTDAKYQKPGQLHPECKLVCAGNGMLTFETSEDLQPLINRMIIYPLEKAVPEGKRDTNIVNKLVAGRNYIITQAMAALQDLVSKDFKFTKVVDAEAYFNSKNFPSGIEEFVETRCVLDETARESSADLYDAYKDFCSVHPEYNVKSLNGFSTYLSEKYHLEYYNNGNYRGKIGIKLLLV